MPRARTPAAIASTRPRLQSEAVDLSSSYRGHNLQLDSGSDSEGDETPGSPPALNVVPSSSSIVIRESFLDNVVMSTSNPSQPSMTRYTTTTTTSTPTTATTTVTSAALGQRALQNALTASPFVPGTPAQQLSAQGTYSVARVISPSYDSPALVLPSPRLPAVLQPTRHGAPASRLRQNRQQGRAGPPVTLQGLEKELVERELVTAQVKIATLDKKLAEEQSRNSILLQRIRLFEHRENNALYQHYFPPNTTSCSPPTTSAPPTQHVTTPHTPIRDQSIPSPHVSLTPPQPSPSQPSLPQSCCQSSSLLLGEFGCLRQQVENLSASVSLMLNTNHASSGNTNIHLQIPGSHLNEVSDEPEVSADTVEFSEVPTDTAEHSDVPSSQTSASGYLRELLGLDGPSDEELQAAQVTAPPSGDSTRTNRRSKFKKSTRAAPLLALAPGQAAAPAPGQAAAPALGQAPAPARAQAAAPARGQTIAPARGQAGAPARGQAVAPALGRAVAPTRGQAVAPASMAPPTWAPPPPSGPPPPWGHPPPWGPATRPPPRHQGRGLLPTPPLLVQQVLLPAQGLSPAQPPPAQGLVQAQQPPVQGLAQAKQPPVQGLVQAQVGQRPPAHGGHRALSSAQQPPAQGLVQAQQPPAQVGQQPRTSTRSKGRKGRDKPARHQTPEALLIDLN